MKMRVRLPHGNLVKQYVITIVGIEFYCTIAIVFLLKVLPCLNKACMYVCTNIIKDATQKTAPSRDPKIMNSQQHARFKLKPIFLQ